VAEENSKIIRETLDLDGEAHDDLSNIYKLVEETFHTSEESASKHEPENIDPKRNLDNDDDGNDYAKRIIKLSEENIKKAGMLLQKYRQHGENDKIITAITASSSPLKKLSTNHIEIVEQGTSANIIKSQNQDIIEGKNNNDKNISSYNQLKENAFTTHDYSSKNFPLQSRWGDDKRLSNQGIQTNFHVENENEENQNDGKTSGKVILDDKSVQTENDVKATEKSIEKIETPFAKPRTLGDSVKPCEDYQSFSDGLKSRELLSRFGMRPTSFHHNCQTELKSPMSGELNASAPAQNLRRSFVERNDTFKTPSHKNCCMGSMEAIRTEKRIQTENRSNHPVFQNVYRSYPHLNYPSRSFSSTPSTPHSCTCVVCKQIKRITPIRPVPAKRSLFPPPPASSRVGTQSSDYSLFSDDDEVMRAANKFLRHVEKRKNRNADSDVSTDISSIDENILKPIKEPETSTSDSKENQQVVNLLQFSSDEDNQKSPNKKEDSLVKANEMVSDIEKKLSNMELETKNLEVSSDLMLSSFSPNTQNIIRELENSLSNLSDGEVLSQGEVQSGLMNDF
jgi:hypothetical protein